MSILPPKHVCNTPNCGNAGKESPIYCWCHKSSLKLLMEERAVLRGLLQAVLDEPAAGHFDTALLKSIAIAIN